MGVQQFRRNQAFEDYTEWQGKFTKLFCGESFLGPSTATAPRVFALLGYHSEQ